MDIKPGKPAGAAEISTWEKKYGCVLPEDVRMFYLTHNGLSLHWSCLHHDTIVAVGRIHIASLSQLQPLATTQSHTHSVRLPSLSDLELDSENDWFPSLSGDGGSSVMVLDYCPTCGHTCLIFPTGSQPPPATDRGCSVWLLDLALSWHQLSPSFTDYLRLATVHLGLHQWPYALTHNTLSPRHEYWFRVFAPHRLEVDMSYHLSTSQGPASQQRSEAETGLNVVDVSKVLQVKPSRDKSGSGRLRSASSRQSSQVSPSRRSTTKTN